MLILKDSLRIKKFLLKDSMNYPKMWLKKLIRSRILNCFLKIKIKSLKFLIKKLEKNKRNLYFRFQKEIF